MWGEYTSSNIITYIALSCKSVRIIERALWETLKPYGQYITVSGIDLCPEAGQHLVSPGIRLKDHGLMGLGGSIA